MEAAEASDPGLDLSYEKGLLALAAKSVALGAIADAQAVANASNDLRKIATAEGLVDLGDDLLTAEEHVEAAGNYQEAVRAVQG